VNPLGDQDVAKENLEGLVALTFPGTKVSYQDIVSKEGGAKVARRTQKVL